MNNIETEKSRIVLDELENDWWILVVGGLLCACVFNMPS